MVWNKLLPADDTKLRVSQGYVRQNWDAIETGGVPYDKLKLESQGANPTREAGFGWVYGKNPGTGFTELYYEDDVNPANVIQLTSNNQLGSAATRVIGLSYTFNGTYLNTQPNFVSAWARCSSAGGILGTSMLVTGNARTGTGSYTVSTAAVFTSANFALSLTTAELSGERPGGIVWLTKSMLGGIATVTIQIRGRDGSLRDADFDIVFYGGVQI